MCLQTNLLLLEIVMLREYSYLSYDINERTKNYHYSSNIKKSLTSVMARRLLHLPPPPLSLSVFHLQVHVMLLLNAN